MEMEMELLGPSAKRRRAEDLAAGAPSPGATEATEAANPGPTTHSEETSPPPDAAAGGGGGGGDDGVDRISGLPDAVLGEIVSLLSTKEAARTQILASRWRHVWLAASPLVLDGKDLYNNKRKALLSSDDDSSDESESDSDDDEETFNTGGDKALAGVVSHILSAHPGPVRRFCLPSFYFHSRPAAVDAWLSSPKLDNLQGLEFWEPRDVAWHIAPYPLALPPASTFRFSATLRVATLGKCEILDSSVEGIHFPNLKLLGLKDVSISEGSLHTIISSSPVLEFLLLKYIYGVGCLQITSNSLRSISVDAGVGHCRFSGNPQLLQEVIIVDAPCLERFLDLVRKPINLTVISAPRLETLGCLRDDLFHPRLVFGTTAIEGLKVISLTTALSTVKTLAVTSDHINLDTVVELMKCFPGLEKLYIIKCSISGEMNRWRRKHRDFIKSFDIRLKTIVLGQYRGTRSQVNFASFFLLNAKDLESMKLQVEFKDYNEAFFTKQHGMLQMEKRALRGARLHFTKKICARVAHVSHVLSIADPFECRC